MPGKKHLGCKAGHSTGLTSFLKTHHFNPFLVGCFNPFEKYARQIGSFPEGFKTTRFFAMMHSTLHPTFYDIPIQDLTFLVFFISQPCSSQDWNIYLYMYHKFQPNVGKNSNPHGTYIPGAISNHTRNS